MAKIALVPADESRLQHLAGLITQAANHVVQRTCATPSQALTRSDPGQGNDLLILEASRFSSDDLQQLRRLSSKHPETLCMPLTEAPSADLLMRAMCASAQCMSPWPPEAQEFRDGVQRYTSYALSSSYNDGQVVSFLSCRGGSGTTFIVANSAHVLSARHGKRVLLIDLCQQYGDAAFLLTDQSPPTTLANVCNQIDRLDATLLDACLTHVSQDSDVLAGAGDPIRSGEIRATHLERILTLAASMYDVVVFDIGQDINPVSIVVLDYGNVIYPVLRLSLPYLRAGRKLMEICHSLGYRAERLRLIINQYDKHVPISQNMMGSVFGMPVAHILSYDPGPVCDATTQGMSVLQLAENSPIARALADMVRQLFPGSQHRRDGLLRKLFRHASQAPAPVRA